MRRRRATLPLRLWLALALAAIVGIPTLATWGVSQAIPLWQHQAAQSQLATVRRVVGVDVARWRDPAWQRRAGAAFAAMGVDVVLVDRTGLVYTNSLASTTGGVRRLLSAKFSLLSATLTLGPSPSPGKEQASHATRTTTPIVNWISPSQARIVIWGPGSRATGPAAVRRPLGAAYLWFAPPLPGVPASWAKQAAGLIALLLTLAVVAWFLGRSVLRPLDAMSRAAQQIAGGDLDVRLPSSQAREVAEVATALAAMSAALNTALERQAALEEERRLFISAIAHDLRTPLFMLRGYLKGLESGVATTPEKVAHYVRACAERADALERLIADLFAYTRLEYLEQAPQRESLDLGVLLRQVVEDVHLPATAKGIAVTLDGPCECCPFAADGHLLTRAVGNLLDNAVRHTPPNGRIHVRWRQEGATLVVTVADSGPGIAPHDLPHLFTPLYRGEASRNRATGGAGLGLAIARRILQAHGGDLAAANGATGGAVFTATLPLSGL